MSSPAKPPAPPSDPLVNFYWEALSPRAQVVVAAQAERIAAALRAQGEWMIRNCDEASARWARAFRAAGVPVRIVHGAYYLGEDAQALEAIGELPLSSDHTWLQVDGFLVDPTASQFIDHFGPIKPEGYRPNPRRGQAIRQ